MKHIKRLLMACIAFVMIFSMVFTMSACDMNSGSGKQDSADDPDNAWGDDIKVTPGQNGYGGEGKIKITFKATYAGETETATVTVNASSATVEAFVRDFLKSPLGNMAFAELFPYGVWELNGEVMSVNDILVTLRNGDTLHLKLHTLPEAMGGSGGTVDGTVDFENPDQIWGEDVTPTPGQNGYGAAGEIKIGFKISYRGEEDEVVIAVNAQSITLEALIRDYLDGPLGGMSYTEILAYGSWYLNGEMLGINGAASVLENRDVITLSMRRLPGEEDDPVGPDPNPGDSDEYVLVEVVTSDGSSTHRHFVTASSGTESLSSIVYIAGFDMNQLLAKDVTVNVNGAPIKSTTYAVKNGDHVYIDVTGTDFDSNTKPNPDVNETVSVILLYTDNTFESYSRDVYENISLSEFLALYMELDFDKMLRNGKWRVDGEDVSSGDYMLRGGESVMFRQNGLNNSNEWGTGIKGMVTTHELLVYPFDIKLSTTGTTAAELYENYFSHIFGIDLDKALNENHLLLMIDDARVFDLADAKETKIYPDSVVNIYWYGIPEEYEDVFAENMYETVDAQVCLSYLDGSADYIGFWALPGVTVREAFEDYGYCFEYYAQYGRFLDSDDREISGDSLIPADGYFRWLQESPFPTFDFAFGDDPEDFDFSIKLGFRFEDQFKEETVWFAKDGYTLDKFYQLYLSDTFFDGWDYNNLSKCGSWYFENKLCTKSTVITDGGYLEFRFSFIPEDSGFEALFDSTTPKPEVMFIVSIDFSALIKDGTAVPTVMLSLNEGSTLRDAVNRALKQYDMSYDDTADMRGYWTVNGNTVQSTYLLKSGDKIQYVALGGEGGEGGDDGGTTTQQITVYLMEMNSNGMMHRQPYAVDLGTTLAELVDRGYKESYEVMLEDGYFAVNEAFVEDGYSYVLCEGDEILYILHGSGDEDLMILVYLTFISDGHPETVEAELRAGSTLRDLADIYTSWGYDGSLLYGYWTVNGSEAVKPEMILSGGDEIEFIITSDEGGGEPGGDDGTHTHEWNAENGTCGTCSEPCPVDHATEAIFAPCYVCGFAGYAGGGYEHRSITIYVNGEYYTTVTVSYMPGEYPTMNAVLALTDLGTFNELNERYVILSNERESEWTSGNNKLYYDTEIYINDRPEEIPPAVWYTVYFTKFYAGDNWQHAKKGMWMELENGTTLTDAFSHLGADVWENDHIWVNGTLVTDWNSVQITSTTYIVILQDGIENASITATVVNELTGETRKVVYEAPVYFSMVQGDLIGTLADGQTWNIAVDNGDWGTSISEYAIAYNFTVTIMEKTTNVSVKVVDADGKPAVLTQSIKGELPTLAEFVKTYLGGDPEAYYFASVDGGELRELTADDTVPAYYGYIIPKALIKDEITITYDVSHKYNGNISGRITVKAPVLLYSVFDGLEEGYWITEVLRDAWQYEIMVDGVALSEEEKGGNFLLLWSDCTLTARPCYNIRIEYTEYMGDIPMIDPIQVTDPDMTIAEVLELMGVDPSLFIIDMDLSMRVGEAFHDLDNAIIYARPKTLRFELTVIDSQGMEMWYRLEGFLGSVTLEELFNRFSEMYGMFAGDYVWMIKDPMMGELIELTDPAYTWYYNEEIGNGEYYIQLESKNLWIWVEIVDGNGYMIDRREVFVQNGATVAEVLAEFGYSTAEIMQIYNMSYGVTMTLEDVITQKIDLQIMLNRCNLWVYITGDNGATFFDSEMQLTGRVTLADILDKAGYSAEFLRYAMLDGMNLSAEDEIKGGTRLDIYLIYYPIYFYIEDEYGNFVVDVYEWIWGRVTVGELLERFGNGYTWDQIASGDCFMGEAYADTVIEFEDKIILRLYPTDGEGEGSKDETITVYIEEEIDGKPSHTMYELKIGTTLAEFMNGMSGMSYESVLAYGYYFTVNGQPVKDGYSYVLQHKDGVRLIPNGEDANGGIAEGMIIVYFEEEKYGALVHTAYEVTSGMTLADFLKVNFYTSYESVLEMGYYITVEDHYVKGDYVLQSKDVVRLVTGAPDDEDSESEKPTFFTVYYADIAYSLESPICLRDFIINYLDHDMDYDGVNGMWYVNGMAVSTYDYWLTEDCALTYEWQGGIMGFEVYYNGVSHWVDYPISLYDFICKYLGADMDAEGMHGIWYVDGMMVASTYDYILTYPCSLYYEGVMTEGFEVYYNGVSYWVDYPISLYDFICKYLGADMDAEGMHGIWYVDGMTMVSTYDCILTYSCSIHYESMIYKSEIVA